MIDRRTRGWAVALVALATTGCEPDAPIAAAATATPTPTASAWLPSLAGTATGTGDLGARSGPRSPEPAKPARETDNGTDTGTGTGDLGARSGPRSPEPAKPARDTGTGTATPPPPCPSEMALVGRTCVDRFEAHLLRVADDGTRTVHPYNERPAAGVRYAAASEAGQKPQGYISRVESEAACKVAGKRLCSRREWRAACRGPGGSRWPYGAQGVRGRCNSGKPHLLTVHFGDVRNIRYDEHFNSPLLNADPLGLAAAGAHDGCRSEHGTFDMVGNLHEWVSGTVDADLVYELEEERVERRDQPWQTGNGIFLGGFYSTTSEHGAGCDFITIAHEPTYHDYSTGFRCCRDAELPRITEPRGKRRAPAPAGSGTAPR